MYMYVELFASENKSDITDYNPNQLEDCWFNSKKNECWLRVGGKTSPLFCVATMKMLLPWRIV